MPDLLTNLLAKRSLPNPTPEQQAQADAQTKLAQAKGPLWKQLADRAISGGVGALKGLTGIGDQGPAGPTATNAGALLGAAVPFLGMGGEALSGLKGFYSRVDKVAQELPELIHPNKAISLFKNNASPEEMSYRGLDKFLASKGNQMIPKSEIIDHLTKNPAPQVGVKTLSGEGFKSMHGMPVTQTNAYLDSIKDAPKYSGYQLPGGENYRENLFTLPSTPKTTVPNISLEDVATPHSYIDEAGMRQHTWLASPGGEQHFNWDAGEPLTPSYEDPTHARAHAQDEVNRMLGNLQRGDNDYRSPHWNDPNVLAHSRTQDRHLPPTGEHPTWLQTIKPNAITQGTAPGLGDKIRNIENVQSDWHQTGAKEGYDTPEVRQHQLDIGSRNDAINQSLRDLRPDVVRAIGNIQLGGGFDGQNGPGVGSLKDYLDRFSRHPDTWHQSLNGYQVPAEDTERINHYLALRDEERRTHQEIMNTPTSLPPDAPFKSSWPDLALKHQLLDASRDPSITGISVTPGGELMKRGEGHSPQMNDQQLPGTLSRLLKPFGGEEPSTVEYPGKPRELHFSPPPEDWNNAPIYKEIGPYGGAIDPAAGQVIANHSGYEPNAWGDTRKLQEGGTPHSQPFMDYLREHQPATAVKAPLFKLTPEIKQAILKKGFPLLSLPLAGALADRQDQ